MALGGLLIFCGNVSGHCQRFSVNRFIIMLSPGRNLENSPMERTKPHKLQLHLTCPITSETPPTADTNYKRAHHVIYPTRQRTLETIPETDLVNTSHHTPAHGFVGCWPSGVLVP
jgi:hypothetical protein